MANKWLVLLAACGLALTVTACGDDDEPTSCTSSEDCADDESCDISCQLCAPMTGLCALDANCGAGETCLPFADGCTVRTCQAGTTDGCASDTDCASTENCDTSCQLCVPTEGQCVDGTDCATGEVCEPFAEGCTVTTCKPGPAPTDCTKETFGVCYDLDQFCDYDETNAGVCADIDVGSCAAVAGKETPAANGPMIYYVEANGACVENDETNCQGGTSCAFNVYFWDKEGDVDAEYSDVKYVNNAGDVGVIGNVGGSNFDGNYGAVLVYTCTGPNPTALLIQDNAGNRSNAMCLANRPQAEE